MKISRVLIFAGLCGVAVASYLLLAGSDADVETACTSCDARHKAYRKMKRSLGDTPLDMNASTKD